MVGKLSGTCPLCHDARFVCEDHPRLAWPDECNCGAPGKPCPVCNAAPGRPRLRDGFVIDEEVDEELPGENR
ncbi:hypothetical protein D8676_11690 [Mesorhizobium sp. YM1C-6-2]|nr:hypothetical protein D8676_11690 [Mesorhizobium sp. YM1C-6-2]